jgi:DNA-binding NarL/FixJ family response regulator
MNSCRIILADDHALMRQGLKRILSEIPELEVVAEARDGLELLQVMNTVSSDLIIIDISMPKLRGIEAIHEIKARCPNVKVLVLTMHKDSEYLRQAVSAGADGYLLKEDADAELFSAIEKIRKGKIFITQRLSEELTDDWARIKRGDAKPLTNQEKLTLREKEVLKMIAEGKSSKEIASAFFISARTVDHHRANIMEKLQLRKTVDLVKYAIEKGYL